MGVLIRFRSSFNSKVNDLERRTILDVPSTWNPEPAMWASVGLGNRWG
jgi:hypothetical protein